MGLIEDHHWWWVFEVLMHSCLVPFPRDHFFHLVWCEKLYKILVWRILHPGQVWVVVQRLRGVDGGHGMSNGVWGMGFLWDEWFAVQCFDFPLHFLPKLSQFKETSSQTLLLPLCLSQWIHVMWMPLSPSLVVLCWGKIWALTYSNKKSHISFGLLHQIVEYWQDIIRWCPRAQVPSNIYVHLLGHFSLCQTTWLEWPFLCSFQLGHMYGEGSWPLESVLSERLCAEAREVQGGWQLQISVSCGSQFLRFVTVFQC